MSMVLTSLRPIPVARPANAPHSPSPQTLVREPQQVLRTATAEQELISTQHRAATATAKAQHGGLYSRRQQTADAARHRRRISEGDSSASDSSSTLHQTHIDISLTMIATRTVYLPYTICDIPTNPITKKPRN